MLLLSLVAGAALDIHLLSFFSWEAALASTVLGLSEWAVEDEEREERLLTARD